MSDLSFRKATKEDAAQIAALVNSAYRGESSKQGWTTEADFLGGQRTDEGEITKLIEADGSLILLCFQENEMIGSVHLERSDAGAYLGMFTVKPTLQARGIGKRFLEVAERTVQTEWGAKRIVMAVITRRTELIAFYERRGYRRTGRFETFPNDIKFGIPTVPDLRFELLEKTLTL
ncbi:MAG: GNAT family N-acetyltransferase [Sulfurifustaceae bacterium]